MAKEGSTIGGLMDCFGTAMSMSLQYGVPLEVYVNKFSHTRFEPMGHTKNPDIRIAKSVVDYIFRWLGIQFLPGYREAKLGKLAARSRGQEGRRSEAESKPAAKKAGGPKSGARSGPSARVSPVAVRLSRQPTAQTPAAKVGAAKADRLERARRDATST